MSVNLSQSRVVVAVVAMEGCGACEEYLPRFKQIAKKYEHCLPIIVLDAAKPEHGAIADRYRVYETPTTLILRKPIGLVRFVGGLPDNEIERVFLIAMRGLSCEI